MTQFNFKAIGTTWKIDIYKNLDNVKESDLFEKIKNRVDLFDKAYSRFRDDSLVTKMSKEIGIYVLPADAKPMISLYHDLYMLTDGFFTPFVGNMLSDAGYDKEYSLQQKKVLRKPPKWDEALEYDGENTLKIIKPQLLDFGAGGKGYIIDLISETIEENSIYEYCIDAGGDILHKNKTPLRVGLENPDDVKQVIGVYNLGNESICGSAGNRRAWNNFTHIINPKTLTSPREISAVWVVTEKAILADSLTTCLFFVSADVLLKKYKFEYMIIWSDHSFEKSKNFSAEIFT